ncbi:TIGR01777 family oxidoreductase [Muriicola soli]|uniref:TIGR01777 family protein n=1 Tax=Muriicola soli TaxID=2507538 RepID=A0A411EAK3_9FLAO|nr:TIGR01777 family oxidoreductase [Muriicola soli]QBA64689.1 TIGR01777 family protein [Muriicola soli]
MCILITGATGLIGNAIVQKCRDNNINVNFLTTRKNKLKKEEGLKGFYWNPKKGEIDLACFEGVTAVINLAGSSISQRWTKANKKKILDSRLNSLQTLRSALKKIDTSEISSFVSASAIGIYPHSFDHYYSEEEKEVDNSFLGEVVSKWEQEIQEFTKFPFSVATLRVGLVLSMDGGALPAIVRPVKAYVGAAFGSGEQWQSWIHIDDLARQFLFIVEHSLEGVFNGVAPNPVTNNRLVKEVAEVMNRPILLPNIPQGLMRLILGEMSLILFVSQRVSSKKIEEEGFDFYYKNICNALENVIQSEEKESDIYHKEFV